MLIIPVITFQDFREIFSSIITKKMFLFARDEFFVWLFVKCQEIERACVFIYSFIGIADKVMGIYFLVLSYPNSRIRDEIRGAGHVLDVVLVQSDQP